MNARTTPRALVVTAAVVTVVTLAPGCATTRASDGRFPSQAELDALLGAPPPKGDPARGLDVTEWALMGPLPDEMGGARHAPEGEIEAVLARALDGRSGVKQSEAMHCVAREVAAFFLAHGAYPGDRIQEFVRGRCGTAAFSLGMQGLGGDLEGWSGAGLVPPEWLADVERMVRAALARDSFYGEAGIALVRQGAKAQIVVVTGQLAVDIGRIALVPNDTGHVQLEGTLRIPSDHVTAVITEGRYRAIACAPDVAVRMPTFSFVCPTSASDAFARIEVTSYQAGRVLGDAVLDVLVRPDGSAGDRYQRVRYAEPRALIEGEDPRRAVVDVLNRVRADAGLAPVAVEEAQAEVASKAAPYFFGALIKQDQPVHDKIALGMMAGWKVSSIVARGEMTWGVVRQTLDVSELLSVTLESPSARMALLDEHIDRIAAGVVVAREHDVIAALFGAYDTFPATAFEDEAERAFAHLAARRAAAGAEPPRELKAAMPVALAVARDLDAGKVSAAEALDQLAERCVKATKQGVNVRALYASKLEEIELPKELLEKPAVDVALAVAHVRDDDGPWGYVVVLIVTPLASKSRLTSVDGGTRVAVAATTAR